MRWTHVRGVRSVHDVRDCLGRWQRLRLRDTQDVNTGHKELVVVKNTARELESEYYLDDEGSCGTPTGKKARRIRQMRMMEMERERLQQGGGEEKRIVLEDSGGDCAATDANEDRE